jgi:hypothetical protein
MVEMDVQMVDGNIDQLESQVDELSALGKEAVNNGLQKTAAEVKKDIEDTAPVDTGDYEGSWYTKQVSENLVFVLSDSDKAPHNVHLLFPNSNFVGSPGADIPSQGIYHNVKGVAKSHNDDLIENITNEVERIQQEA